ncbi:MAG: hypothetical protein QW074_07765 [Candidatus Caldarchaeum sp.]
MRRLDDLLVLAMAFASWLISFYIHHPTVEGSIYSDIVSFWHHEPRLQAGLIPCLQYFFKARSSRRHVDNSL